MAKAYTYPRTTVDVVAKRHSSVQPVANDTTVLFVPLITKKGPDKEVVPIHTLNEFISVFGELDYDVNGQMALNVYNWLLNGGTVYVYRLTNASVATLNTKKSTSVVIGEEVKELSPSRDSAVQNDSWRWLKGNLVKVYANGNEDIFYPGAVVDEDGKLLTTAAGDVYGYAAGSFSADIENPTVSDVTFPTDVEEEPGSDEDDEPAEEPTATETVSCKALVALKANGSYEVVNFTYESFDDSDESNVVPQEMGTAKYSGVYYNDMSIVITPITKKEDNTLDYFNMSVIIEDVDTKARLVVEQYYKLTVDSCLAAITASDYIGTLNKNALAGLQVTGEARDYDQITIYANNAALIEGRETDKKCLEAFWTGTFDSDSESTEATYPASLLNDLETPIDLIIDAGYSYAIKAAMANFVKVYRPDIVLLLDAVVLEDRLVTPEPILIPDELDNQAKFSGTKVAIWDQYFTVFDPTFTNQNIYVGPSYFLSKLIPYNDEMYGIQFATAGLRRAILDDALAVNENPTEAKKQQNFDDRINYCEKSSREYAFMNQRMYDGSNAANYTALSFLNNVRVVERMRKDIKRIGRQYLFEFTDAVTLSQLQTVLNRYVTTWISNRTLATGNVTVAKNPFSDEAVDVSLSIKFNGTIEVIAVTITIE